MYFYRYHLVSIATLKTLTFYKVV